MKLNYTIDETDLENVRAVDQAVKDQPDPKIIADMQNTLQVVLGQQAKPITDNIPGPAQATAGWGKASNG